MTTRSGGAVVEDQELLLLLLTQSCRCRCRWCCHWSAGAPHAATQMLRWLILMLDADAVVQMLKAEAENVAAVTCTTPKRLLLNAEAGTVAAAEC